MEQLVRGGFVELQLKTDQMVAEMKAVLAETNKTATAAEAAFNKVANRGVKRTTEALSQQRKEYIKLSDEYRKQKRLETIRKQVVWDHMSFGEKAQNIAGRGASVAGQVSGATAGLAFAGAAAAGQTTFDTLTGSLKMLALAAGSKAQPAIMKISEWIQKLAKIAENAPTGAITGIAGAAAGFKIAGLPGAIIGGIGGGMTEAMASNDRQGRAMAIRAKDNKEELNKLWNEKTTLEGNKWRGWEENNRLIAVKKAIKLLENKATLPDDMKTAGLGMPGSYSGLADLRQQAQMSVFTSGGALEAANKAKELENNQKAMQPVVEEIKGLRQDFKQNGVMPPANAN